MPSSGVGGPCDHCHVTQSPCWRRGPASKPCLCNACGSRYLAKKSLDGYIPIHQRASSMAAARAKPSRPSKAKAVSPAPPVASMKPKRVAMKKLDVSSWSTEAYDSEESELAYFTDNSRAIAAAAPSSSGATESQGNEGSLRGRNQRSLLGDSTRSGKVLRISNQSQLKNLSTEEVARLLVPSLRIKPRKPICPRISVVF